ncbi:putative FAD synthase [Pseudocercospora fuligena]|uniref:FAD synthase n=1 Tax=Pseudocercospora fuligena TaxID=685502 RepID=A0A8H6R9C8_9PEZI|nr:putative FAD synthase [Pseudocercospora fuligena]
MHGTAVGDETKTSEANNRMSNGDTEAKDLAEQCARVNKKVYEFLNQKPRNERVGNVQRMTRESLGVIGEALERYTLSELSFSYNGGKDCLVLLILYLAALHTHSTKTSTPLPPTLRSVYIVSPNPFTSVTSFVQRSSHQYHLSLSQYHKPMREAFSAYLSDHPEVKAIFVGTRRTDPHGGSLTHFDMTDKNWPKFMRIHPVIDWHYAEIWGFIRELEVEYCELYDLGYTSLGGTDDTHPNPALKKQDGEEGYRPAYELVEDEEERLGRDR